jgi:hypothetical protein
VNPSVSRTVSQLDADHARTRSPSARVARRTTRRTRRVHSRALAAVPGVPVDQARAASAVAWLPVWHALRLGDRRARTLCEYPGRCGVAVSRAGARVHAGRED